MGELLYIFISLIARLYLSGSALSSNANTF